jgi:hypothetical protein
LTTATTFVLDANVFIEAARRYYAFDIVPWFWVNLIHHADKGQLLSIDRVKLELERGRDELADWAKHDFAQAFASTDDSSVIDYYGQIMA